MSHKLKLLSVCLILGLVTIAIRGSAVSAEAGGHFLIEEDHVTLTGIQNQKIEFHDPTLENMSCQSVELEGTPFSQETTFTFVLVEPRYTNCKFAGGGLSGSFQFNGCLYQLTFGKDVSKDNTVHFVCPPGQKIETNLSLGSLKCTLTMPPQTPEGGISYEATVINGKSALLATFTLKGIIVETDATSPAFCAKATTAVSELTGTAWIWAHNLNGDPVGISVTGSE